MFTFSFYAKIKQPLMQYISKFCGYFNAIHQVIPDIIVRVTWGNYRGNFTGRLLDGCVSLCNFASEIIILRT